MASIQIWSKDVPGTENGVVTPPQHTYLIFEYDNGNKKILRGGPGGIGVAGLSDIEVVFEEYSESIHGQREFNDWDSIGTHTQGDTVWTGSNSALIDLENEAKAFRDKINQGDYDYYALRQNCHTVTANFLTEQNLSTNDITQLFNNFDDEYLFPADENTLTEDKFIDFLDKSFENFANEIAQQYENLTDNYNQFWTEISNLYQEFQNLKNSTSDWQDWEFGINPDANVNFDGAVNFTPAPPRRRDPLTLDLDGDGIETLALDGSIVFDHNADGLKQGTGWIASDDGLLVMDRDGNGTIDTGRELFGDNTLKSDGSMAIDGLDALADLDNNADGQVDAADSDFENLRVWRDLNSDGISQQNELFTLQELDIVSINTQGEEVSQDQGNGNLISKVTSFIKSDGSVGTTGSVSEQEQLAVDVDLATDPFFREFTDSVQISEENSTLPDMQGSGAVRDLREAAQLDANLASTLSAYSALGSMAEQKSAIHGLLRSWADSADYDDFVERINKTVINNLIHLQFKLREEDSGPTGFTSDDSTNNVISLEIDDAIDNEVSSELEEAIAQIRILEVFTGKKFFDFNDTSSDEETSVQFVIGNRRVSRGIIGLSTTYTITANDLGLEQQRINLINQSYDALVDSVFEALLPQTLFKEYLDALELSITDGDLGIDFTGLETVAAENFANDPVNTVHNLLELYSQNNSLFEGSGWNPYTHLRDLADTTQDHTDEINALFDSYKINILLDGIESGEAIGHSVLVGNNLDNTLTGGSESTSFWGDEGNDTIQAGDGNDSLNGGTGNDTLTARYGHNRLSGDAGDDTLSIERYSNGYNQRNHNNTLIGGTGNDRLEGWTSKDTYIFNRGDGHDTINDYNNYNYGGDDKIVFGEGILREHVVVSRTGNHIVLTINDPDGVADDQIIIEHGVTNSKYRIETLEFTDGSVMTSSEIHALAVEVHGTEGDDALVGTTVNDKLYGEGGNDTLTSRKGNNLFSGDAGDDTITVERYSNGYDQRNYKNTLIGGTGNDRLEGWTTQDTYIFNRGDGHDTINDYNNYNYGGDDKIVFGEGILREHVVVSRTGNHIVLTINDPDGVADDQIIIEHGVTNSKYRIETLEFTDGSVMTSSEIHALAVEVHGTEGDDALVGTTVSDKLYGEGGNDTLTSRMGNNLFSGDAGDDTITVERYSNGYDQRNYKNTLIGGTGNDRLEGWTTQDTYIFNRGDGHDTINDYNNYNYGGDDKIVFGEGILREHVVVSRTGNHIVLTINDPDGVADDQIIIEHGVTNSKYRIETLEFTDGSVMTSSEIHALAVEVHGTEGDDALVGTTVNDKLYGEGGNDTLTSRMGNNLFSGDAGDDTITVERYSNGYDQRNYKNTLIGGTGNDRLEGWTTQDTYIFNRGDGHDTINDYNNYNYGGDDKIVFGEGILREHVVVSRTGNHIVLTINDPDGVADDQIIIEHGVTNSKYRIETLEFTDGSVMTSSEIHALAVEVHGTEGDDALVGTTVNDKLYGEGGNDTLTSRKGNNLFSGDAGDDTITVERYSNGYDQRNYKNTLIGGTGNDRLEGWTTQDTYIFNRGDGHDTINDYNNYNYGGDDKIVFGEGILREHVVVTRTGNHIVLTINDPDGVADDQIIIEHGVTNSKYRIETLEFADGSIMTSSEINSLALGVYGTESDDTLIGTTANDFLSGLKGNDTLISRMGNNLFSGDAGDDTITVERYSNGYDQRNYKNTLIGGTGNDRLEGWTTQDTYIFNRGDGHDTINDYNNYNYGGDDKIVFGEGILREHVVVSRTGNHIVLTINDPDGVADDQIIIEHGVTNSKYRIETLEFTDGSVMTSSEIHALAVEVHGTEGDDALVGTTVNDKLYGEGGNDTLTSRKGNNLFSGDAGDDTITVERYSNGYDQRNYKNTLIGGTGNDRLEGWTTQDTYIFNRGDGHDTINDYNNYNYGGDDKIVFGEGILREHVVVSRTGNHIVLTINDPDGVADDQIIIEHGVTNSKYRIETLEFTDGSVMTSSEIHALAVEVHGTEGDDALVGTTVNDKLYGEGGNDTLTSRKGNNLFSGDAGDDTITVERYSNGYDQRNYKNTLIGGTGNDRLEGWTTQDTYIFNRGDGHDTINDYNNYNYGGDDKIVFGEGILREHVVVTRTGNHIVLTINDPDGVADDQIIIEHGVTNSKYRIETLEFTDGSVMTSSEIHALAVEVHGTEGDDALVGTTVSDKLYGEGGNDTLTSRKGNNLFSGDAGDDTITVERYSNGYDQRNYKNTLIGGTGNDRLEGWTTQDTYIFNRGDGHDTINDYNNYNYGGDDKIVFGEGILREHVVVTRTGNHIVLTINDPDGVADDQIIIEHGVTNSKYRIETLEFTDGSVMTSSEIHALAVEVHGTEGDDALVGTTVNDKLYGEGGNDTLTSRKGNNLFSGDAGDDTITVERYSNGYDQRNYKNTLIGGTGNDRLEGWTTQDTYIFNRGDGHDTINDYNNYNYGGDDKIVFGEGILREHIVVTRTGNHIVLTINDPDGVADDQIIIEHGVTNSKYRIETLEFTDGSVMTSSEIHALAVEVHGTEGDDALVGTTVSDKLYGEGGNDTLTSRKGNNLFSGDAGDDTITVERYSNGYDQRNYKNTLIGGTGNDRLEGWTTQDTYIFNRGDGHDTINDYNYYNYGGDDKVIYDDITDIAELWFERSNNDLVISTVGTDDSITIQSWYSSSKHQIETIETNGHTLDHSKVDALVQAMAVFDAPSGAGEEIPQNIKDQLQPVLATSWQAAG
ncbi:calcium-binding protein [Neptuniibacter sp. QD72_48]|uniref:calcium-binding protein n=1 Tax=Neptuniibacter sp. QD72_48 TaxID=3398214 RepID=UPI0039F5A40A